MGSMFNGTSSLANLNVGSFNTSNVNDMGYMFNEVRKITNLDLSSFNTVNVKNMVGMFSGVSSLEKLDLTNFDTNKVTEMTNMFDGMKLVKLTLGNTFKFVGNAKLGSPVWTGEYDSTGRWIREDGQSIGYNPSDFMEKYGTDDLVAGTYTGEEARWGTSPYKFASEQGILTLGSGTLGESGSSPWNREDGLAISTATVKKLS